MATATRETFFMEISPGHYLVNGCGYLVNDQVTHYDVEKLTDDGRDVVETYTVVAKGGRVACTCPDCRFRKRECKHIFCVRKYLESW